MGQGQSDNTEHAGEREPQPTVTTPGGGVTCGGSIGPYRLLRVLGEGGFAVVFLAEQHRPIKRRVALKILKPGMDSGQILARFDAERQALALLDHPNIAQIHDGGVSQTGRPYFVMEHVKGIPITEHCDRHKLSIDDRLHLFLSVCDAVHHANQKGIVHRDIKPSNVVVSLEGEQAIPKVIDFGVAKAMAQPLTEQTLFTEQGQMIGTPEYMSPEQAAMTNQEIDARSDVYSLGVLLYELLTGALPFDRRELTHGGLTRIQKIIREEDPPKPSTRLSDLGNESTEIATCRRTEVRTLVKRLRRELEWIPLKAMRKEQQERYQSACELAEDVRCYLRDQPLVARPPTAIYRARKYLKKHRTAGITAGLLISIVANILFIGSYFHGRVEETIKMALAQRARANAKSFQTFLAFWNSGQTGNARQCLASLPEKSREKVAAAFLMDERPLPDKIQDVQADLVSEEAFFWLIVGEHYRNDGDDPNALTAYRQCIDHAGRPSESDFWFVQRATDRISELSRKKQQAEPQSAVFKELRRHARAE